MSLGLHLAVLGSGSVIPSIATRQNPPINPLTDNVELTNEIHARNPHRNGLLAMKEYSLISHIESLKAVANGNIPFIKSNLNGASEVIDNVTDTANTKPFQESSCQQNFPRLVSLSEITDPLELAHPQGLSLPSKWATNPNCVPGNLRIDSAGRPVSLSVEEILSCSSSSMAKRNDIEDNDDDIDESAKKITIKSKRKSAKSSKRKQPKHKDTLKTASGGVEGRRSVPSTQHGMKDGDKKATFLPSTFSDVASITALCKSIKIQEKQPNSISIKQVPYARKTSMSNSPHSKNSSPFRTSLDNAMAEYTKKQSISVSHSNHHRRKVSGADEENPKTTKVFLSEKQSGVLSESGGCFPCAPPATPTPDQLKRYEYVPSLQDIRSQRSFRQRLQMMEMRAMKKEKKKQADCDKLEKMTMRERRIELKRKQRVEIYALNKLMTDLENERFRQFMSSAGNNL